jgi:hypothetical protein
MSEEFFERGDFSLGLIHVPGTLGDAGGVDVLVCGLHVRTKAGVGCLHIGAQAETGGLLLLAELGYAAQGCLGSGVELDVTFLHLLELDGGWAGGG